MRVDDILDAIGNVDDKCVVKAKEPKKLNVVLLVSGTIGSVAAGLVVMFLLLNIMNFIGYSSSGGPSFGGIELQKENISIYYVENGKLERTYEELKPLDKYVIEAWKEKNKISKNVDIQKGITCEDGYVTMYLVISEDFMSCCDTGSLDLILESLKKTMSYSVDKVDEYDISFN